MRLFPGRIPVISAEIARTLAEDGDIETTDVNEVEEDIVAVLKEYLRNDRDLTERAKDTLENRGLTYSAFSRIKKVLAEQQGFGTGENASDYLMQQIIAQFMNSNFVEEIYAEDHEFRVKMKPILHKHMAVDDEVDEEVRNKIKNLTEGTGDWEIEYRKVQEQIMRKKRLSE